MPRVRSEAPPYRQVADHLRQRILDGDLKEGAQVPSERELVRDWNISRGTATKALGVLRSLGLVESARGIGTTVRPLPPGFTDDADEAPTPSERHELARATGRVRAMGEQSAILFHALEVAPADVQKALDLDDGEKAIRRTRVSFIDDDPVELATSWFASDLAGPCPRLLQRPHIEQGTTRYVETRLGITADRLLEIDRAVAASDTDAELLGVGPGTPILETRATIRQADGSPIAYEVYHYPGERTHEHDIAPPTP